MMKRKYSALLAVAGAAVMLGGCNIYRPYSRPQMETAGLYRDTVSVTDTLSGDTVNFGNRPWQEVFTDPKLQSLIEQGLSSNIDLLSAALVVQEYQAQLTAARLAYVPSFTLAPSGELSWVQHGSLQQTYTLPLSASWEVDLFGKLLNSKRGAKAAWLQSEATLRAVRTQVISGIATGYYTLLMLDRQLEITEQTIENWSLTVRMMKAMKLAGNVNEAAVVQSEANYYAVCASKTDLLRSIRETENALSLLLGQPGQHIDRGAWDEQQLPDDFSAGVPVQLLSNRPDVQAAEMALVAATANTNVARSAFYPQLSIGANGGWTNNLGAMIVNPAQAIFNATGNLVAPLFARGQNRARLKTAKAQQEEARLAFQKSLLSAGNEVSDALFQYNSAAEKEAFRKEQIASLERSVSYSEQLLYLGTSTYLEVITAQQSLLSAQLSGVQDRFEQMQAVVYLYQALGGGR